MKLSILDVSSSLALPVSQTNSLKLMFQEIIDLILLFQLWTYHYVKSIKMRNFFLGPYFSVFGLSAKIYRVNLRIQSK